MLGNLPVARTTSLCLIVASWGQKGQSEKLDILPGFHQSYHMHSQHGKCVQRKEPAHFGASSV